MLLTLAVGSLAGVLIWSRVKRSSELILGLDRAKRMIPVVGKLVEAREAGRFARALGTLLVAKVPLMSAMRTASALVYQPASPRALSEINRAGAGRHAAAPGV